MELNQRKINEQQDNFNQLHNFYIVPIEEKIVKGLENFETRHLKKELTKLRDFINKGHLPDLNDKQRIVLINKVTKCFDTLKEMLATREHIPSPKEYRKQRQQEKQKR